jgi:hypothetical protein
MRSSQAERASTSLAATQINAGTVVWLNVRQHHRDTFSARIKKKALAMAAYMEQLIFVVECLITPRPSNTTLHPKNRNVTNCAVVLPFRSCSEMHRSAAAPRNPG